MENGNGMNGNGHDLKGPSMGFFGRLFNIAPFEWPRVTECWLITFLFKLGSATGWTVITAAFVSRFGIQYLPLLFVMNASLIIASTFFFERFIMRFKREVLMILMLILGSLCLFFASFLYDRSAIAFFTLVIFAESFFLAQFNVFVPILVGDRFTPLESQRTFPFVESGDTIGISIGGAIVGIFASRFPIPWFLHLWIIFLMLTIFVFVIANHLRKSLPPLPFRAKPSTSRERTKDQIRLVMKGMGKFPFLKSLVVIVLLQWVFMNILDFQYTKAMEQSVTKKNEPTIALIDPKVFRAAVLSSSEGVRNIPLLQPKSEVKRVLTVDEQQELTRKLGTWKSIFHIGALLAQVLLASRLITALGVVGSMLLHPIIMLMSLVGMFLKFGFLSAIITRLNFETTYAVHKNAYLASHYAFPKFLRDQTAEFLEGIVRPLGTIMAVTVIAFVQLFSSGRELSMWLHIAMVILMMAMLISNIRLQAKYTKISRDQLFGDLPYPDKLNAIEILAQQGHQNVADIFVMKLNMGDQESPIVRRKIIAELGRFRDYRTLPEILEALYDKHSDTRLEAAHALLNFHDLGEKFYTQAFSRFRTVETLKDVFRNEKSYAVKRAIIKVFSLLRQPDIVPFLLDILRNGDPAARADCVYTLGLFRDPNAAYYIFPYISSEQDPRIRANALISLWQFPQHRDLIRKELTQMFQSIDAETQKAGIFAGGEIGEIDQAVIADFLHSADPMVRREAAFALTKCADPNGFEILLTEALNSSPEDFEMFERFFRRLKPNARSIVDRILIHTVSEELEDIMHTYGDLALSQMPRDILERLRRLYTLLDQHEELFALEQVIKAQPTGASEASAKPLLRPSGATL